MSDFFSAAGIGIVLGFLLTVVVCGGIISKCSFTATENKLGDKHCQHLDSRSEFTKCKEEFLK